MWPMRRLDDVAVAEVAGDGLRLGGRLDDDETFAICPSARNTLADARWRVLLAMLAPRPSPIYLARSPRSSWPSLDGLVPVFRVCRQAGVEHLPAGRLRARRQPPLELRPLAARDAALPAAVPALHGEVGALLVRRSSTFIDACGAFPVRRGQRDLEAIETAIAALPRGAHRRHVPGGHAAQEGAAEEVRGARRTRARRGSRSRRTCRSSRPGSSAPTGSAGCAQLRVAYRRRRSRSTTSPAARTRRRSRPSG